LTSGGRGIGVGDCRHAANDSRTGSRRFAAANGGIDPRKSKLDIPRFFAAGRNRDPLLREHKNSTRRKRGVFGSQILNSRIASASPRHARAMVLRHIFCSLNFCGCLCVKTQCLFLFLVMNCDLDKGIPGASR
jgi:hypothetical protein